MVHVVLAGVVDHRGVVAGALHRVDQVVLGDLPAVFDVRALHGEVHRRPHTVQIIEAALDLRGAGRAAHPGHLEIRRRHTANYTPRGYIVKGW